MRKDPVTPELHEYVLRRDGGCVAPRITSNGHMHLGQCSGRLTLDHVKDQPRMGKRALSDAAHLVTLCWHHHLDGWATAHRPELRYYISHANARMEAQRRVEGQAEGSMGEETEATTDLLEPGGEDRDMLAVEGNEEP